MTTELKATKVTTGKVRFSYLNAFKPRAAQPGQEAKYSVCLLIPKSDTATVDRIKKAIEAAKTAGIGTFGGKVPPGLKSPLRDGDAERDTAEYKGHWFINANSKNPPGVVDRDLNPIVDANDLQSGDYGRASINFYAYSQNGNRGIAAGLNNLQLLAKGDPLSGRSRPEDDFSAVEDDDFLA